MANGNDTIGEAAALDGANGHADRESRALAAASFPLTDLGNCERFVQQHGAIVRYCPPRRRWLSWDGRRWAFDETGAIPRLAKLTVRSIYAESAHCEDDDRRKALAKHARASETAARLKSLVELAQSEIGIPVMPLELDADPWLFNVANGTIDLHTATLQPHDRARLITRLAPVTYDPNATHELWDRFLLEATGADKQLEAYLRRLAGYALTGLATEKKFFFMHGPKDTCKSTFIDALHAALGDYATTAAFETWCTQSNTGGNRGDLVRLAGARLVTSVEVKRGLKFDEGLLSLITGGDELTCSAKYENEISYRAQFKILLAANNAPKVRDDDDPMWSRLKRVPFVHVIERPDPSVKARLRDPVELGPAVLAWAVRGCQEWQSEGIGTCGAVESSTHAYRQEMDPLDGFLSERVAVAPDAKATRKVLRASYDAWCKDNGVKYTLSARDFTQRIEKICTAATVDDGQGNRVRGWHGIRVLTDWEREEGQ